MKFTLYTLFGGLILSLLFTPTEEVKPKEIVEYTPPKTLTSQEVIESTDLYKRSLKIEDTIQITHKMLQDIRNEKTN